MKKLWLYSRSETVLKTLAILRGQEGPITSCTFNPDVSQLATASRDAVRFLIVSSFITSDYGFMHLFILFVNWNDIYRNVALCYGTPSPIWSAPLLTNILCRVDQKSFSWEDGYDTEKGILLIIFCCCWLLHRALMLADDFVYVCFPQSVYIWDVRQCLLDGRNSQPLRKLHACHSDWITDCQWSNIGDFLVCTCTCIVGHCVYSRRKSIIQWRKNCLICWKFTTN